MNKSGKGHNTLRTENNEVLSTSEDKGQALMATREDIWFQRSHHELNPGQLLQAYAESRQHTLSTVPNVSHPLLRGVVLAAFGTAPGKDGAPYEAYHLHPQLFAVLLEQAFVTIQTDIKQDPHSGERSALFRILGPSTDLQVWIPKKIHNNLVNQQRPLQLPTCLRRRFGSACAQLLGPTMDRQLEGAQAPVHGGHCYKNIKNAHEHLARTEDPELPPYRLPHCHWACEMLFGPACATLLLICKERQRRAHHSIRRSPACLLIDQAKAFEMLCHL